MQCVSAFLPVFRLAQEPPPTQRVPAWISIFFEKQNLKKNLFIIFCRLFSNYYTDFFSHILIKNELI